MKRLFPVMLVLMLLLWGCGKEEPQQVSSPPESAGTENAAESANDGGIRLMGMIIQDDGSMSGYMMMHGFLHTVENLGYPAKLYRVKGDASAMVQKAVDDGCTGLLIPGSYTEAVRRAHDAGLYVVCPYEAYNGDEADVNVVADVSEYIEELARGIAERMTERGLKSGRILVYGSNTGSCFPAFGAAVKEYYPQFDTVSFNRTPGLGDDGAINELSDYLLNNRDIKGLYACDESSVPVAVKARSKAIAAFKDIEAAEKASEKETKKKEPESAPTPEPSADSAKPTPNPALLKQISITAFGCGLSDENLELFKDNDIYGLCIEPYYDAAATATMMLDRLMQGEDTAKKVTVNRPIAYGDTIDKYKAIYNEVKELFDVE